MRLSVLLIILLLCPCLRIAFSQSLNFEDGFEDGNFTAEPAWSGDTGDFGVIEGDPNYLLQLQGDSENGGISYLSTRATAVTGSWEFYIRLDFAPSEGNRADIFLMSDIADLKGPLNGYVLRAGESGSSDVFRLVRYDSGNEGAILLSGTTDIGSGGEFRVRVTRQSGGIWALETGRGYDGALNPEGGTHTDNTYSDSGYFGVRAAYTPTRHNRFFFDFKIDLAPFSITGISADGKDIDITFNRPHDPASAEPDDFSLDGGAGSPDSVTHTGEQTLRLTYDSELPSGKRRLGVTGVMDKNGVSISPGFTAEFFIFAEFAPGDLVINEFMYDPPDHLEEYVELKNVSGKYFNLRDWQIGDSANLSAVSSDTVVFEAGGFMVLSRDTIALFQTFGHRNYLQIALPFLNNDRDTIRLLDERGISVDSLSYESEWGGGDIALERRSAAAGAAYRENWGESPDLSGGTPGMPNSVSEDSEAPVFLSVTAVDAITLRLLFSERLSPESATAPENYAVAPAVGIQAISLSRDTVMLHLETELVSGNSYEVSVRKLADIFGNRLDKLTREIRYLRIDRAGVRDVAINEMLYMRDPGGPEYIELYNVSGKNFNLHGWRLGDGSALVTLTDDLHLSPGGYVVLTDNRSFAGEAGNIFYIPGFPSLNDSGDIVYLRNETGTTVDSLRYTPDWGGNSPGISLERKDPEAASNDPSNWKTSSGTAGRTPGARNSVFEADTHPPEIIFSKQAEEGGIEVYANEFITLAAGTEFSMGPIPLRIAGFNPDQGNRIRLSVPRLKRTGAGKRDAGTAITVRNLTDVKGNLTVSAEIALSHRVHPGDLVVNEIMYNPLSDSDDNLPDQSEYIELRNTRDYALSLEGLRLHDAPDEKNAVRTLTPESTTGKWVPAEGTALLYADESPGFGNSRISEYFNLGDGEKSSVLRIDRSTLSLASSGDAAFIADSTGSTIDSVFYDESWQNPNLIDTRGIALERIDPGGPGGAAFNWGSSVSEKGGTPGSENSIYQSPSGRSADIGISFSPNPFSPDDDGYEDNLFISYLLNSADNLIRIRIYDRYGRLVRKLADGRPGGFEGSVIWDGRRDDGSRNRIGIYIVVFEAYDSSTGRNRAFKETVVLARRLN